MADRIRRGAWDIELNGIGMMLVRGRTGALSYVDEALPFVPERQLDSDMSYASLPPEEAASKALTRFDGGLGRRVEPTEEIGEVYYFYPADVGADGAVISPPLVTSVDTGVGAGVTDFYRLGTNLYALVGRYALVTSDGATWTVSKDFGAGQVARNAETFAGTQPTEHAFVALGSTGTAQKFWVHDGTTWTQHASKYADYFCRYRSELHRVFLDGASNGWTVEKSANGGTTSSWSGATIIGDGVGRATGLTVHADSLYVPRSDGLFEVTKDTTPDDADLLGGFIKERRDDLNGVNTFAWHDYLFYPTAAGGLYCRMSDGTTFECGPTNKTQNRSPIRGRVTAISGDDNWLYIALHNPLVGESYLCKGRISDYSQSNNRPSFDWVGALVIWTGDITVDALEIAGVPGPNPRLYCGRSDGRIDWLALPRAGMDPRQDAADGGGCRARQFGYVYLPETTATFINQQKDWVSDQVETENAAVGLRYVDEGFRTSDAAAWSTLGRFETDGQAAIAFGAVTGRRLQRRLTLYTSSATAYIAVRSIVLAYVLRFPDRPRFSFVVDATQGGARLNGGLLQRMDANDVVEVIRQAKASAGGVAFRAPTGAAYLVHVRTRRVTNTIAEAGQPLVWQVEVMATAKAERGNLAVYSQSRYGGGDIYA